MEGAGGGGGGGGVDDLKHPGSHKHAETTSEVLKGSAVIQGHSTVLIKPFVQQGHGSDSETETRSRPHQPITELQRRLLPPTGREHTQSYVGSTCRR